MSLSRILATASVVALTASLMTACGEEQAKHPLFFDFPETQSASSWSQLNPNFYYEVVELRGQQLNQKSAGEVFSGVYKHTPATPGQFKEGDAFEHHFEGQTPSGYLWVGVQPHVTVPREIHIDDKNSPVFMRLMDHYATVKSDATFRWNTYSASSTLQPTCPAASYWTLSKTENGFNKPFISNNARTKMIVIESSGGYASKFALYHELKDSDDTKDQFMITYQITNKKVAGSIPSTISPTNPVPTPKSSQPKIRTSRTEQEIGRVSSNSGGITRDSGGNLRSFSTDQEMIDFGVRNNLDREALEDAVKLRNTIPGGTVGIALNSQALSQTLADMISHMKKQMNRNGGGLDLVLAIDVSGSMENNIKSVIQELKTFTAKIDDIKLAGRTANVGIVTFGLNGEEKCKLPLTSSTVALKDGLDTILREYQIGVNKHSANPGEACYAGLCCAAEELEWSQRNRQVILITDEPSWEERMGRNDLIKKAKDALGSARVYPVIVRIPD